MNVSRQAAHQAAHELVRMDLIELVPDPADRRARLARLSQSGRDLDQRVIAIVREI